MPTGPNLVWWQVGRRLRRLRERAHKTHADVKQSGIASETKMWRIETGQQAVKIADIWALGRLYDATNEEVDELTRLAQDVRRPGWWEGARDVVPGWFGLYVDLEAAAQQIESWHAELVHGLLQTEDYARAVISSDDRLSTEEVEQNVRLRLERQQAVLDRASVTALLGEGATKIQIGSPDVMRGQIQHLLELASAPDIYVGILPWQAGAHRSMRGPFTILSLAAAADPDIVYFETHIGAQYLEEPEHLAEYRRIFAWLYERSMPLEDYI